MTKTLVNRRLQQQANVSDFFSANSSYWKDVYTIRSVQAAVIQDRHVAIQGWINDLALTPGSPVLEVGCGAGLLSVGLARQGLRVHGIDLVEAMVEQAREWAKESGTSDLFSFDVGDVYSLTFDDASFDLVIAVGVLPWLEGAEQAIQEMVRVTKPGGYIILTTANRSGLASLLDPLMCPLLRPTKRYLKDLLVRLAHHRKSPTMVFHSSRAIDRTLSRLGVVKIKGMTRGFAFSFFRRTPLPGPLAIALNRGLQHLADRNIPCLRSTGMTYIVLARKEGHASQTS